MKLLKQKQSVFGQKLTHLGLFIIEQKRSPLGHFGTQRVAAFEKGFAIELPKPMRILGKVCRYPVQHNSESLTVGKVYKEHDIVDAAKP